ncbi:unnamed protein product, partial [Vitis vinifera]
MGERDIKKENVREYHHPHHPTCSTSPTGKGKMWDADPQQDAGMDELLAVLGYNVKASDMAEVAQKLEQLEEVIVNAQEDGLSHLASETVHYNPSDLSNWLGSMLSDTQPKQEPSIFDSPSLDYDLKAIPANSVSSVIGGWGVPTESARPVVLVDSQETGIRLVHTLMACAEAVQQENLKLAEALVKQIGFLAVSQAGAMRKVATYFAEGLARRIYRLYPDKPLDSSMKQGMQWPALMQALALRPGGPPSFRLTGIGPPSTDNTDHLHEVGWKLAQLAETIHVEFEYRGFVANSLADLDASMLELRDGESVAVNSVFELHSLLARPGGIERVLSAVKDMKPDIVTIVEQEANHNGPVFLDRFTESLHYYSTLFDSLEGCGVSPFGNKRIGPFFGSNSMMKSLFQLNLDF